ncbi:carbohydrate porin [Sphingomonas sp. BIUV-7]|uniref:Carbohydrate porin n=1 Tax=Sphingomonas natans TaxID=3063330 RepID=A0ABT8Y7A0_9SPHN|nr:carbohydrate porin [Sphingomonas sp. BIUV-7]MDO6414184.1 carbohydrate porin [Sphingomonas sp. BIUV-7]
MNNTKLVQKGVSWRQSSQQYRWQATQIIPSTRNVSLNRHLTHTVAPPLVLDGAGDAFAVDRMTPRLPCRRRAQSAILVLSASLLIGWSGTALAQSRDVVPDANPDSLAADTQEHASAPPTLTGEWGGLRTRIRDAGVDLNASYVSELATNISGGARKDATETGQLAFGAAIDTEKLFGLRGGLVQASITYRRGHNLTDRAGLGLLQQVQEVYGRGQTWRLTRLWYQQSLGGGVDVKLGRIPGGGEFNAFSCDFMNLSLCGAPAGNLAGDYWYNWPISQWGVRLRMKKTRWYAQAGVYEQNPRNLNNRFIVGYFHGAKGALVPMEVGYTPRLAAGLPGIYRLGAWYNTANANDLLLDGSHRPYAVTGLAPLRRDGRYGAYVMLQQQITGAAKLDANGQPSTIKGLTLFLNITQTDRRTQRTDNQISTGLFLTGAIAFRPHDDIGLGFARTNVNGRADRSEGLSDPGTPRAKAEYAGEFFYSVHLAPWLILRPNFQYVLNPGGRAALPDVVVLGLKSAITF